MSGHTKGPWVADRYGTVTGTDAEVCDLLGRIGAAEFKANARLIAAAPELLEAGEMLIAEAKKGRGVTADALNRLMDAIAKAKGETA